MENQPEPSVEFKPAPAPAAPAAAAVENPTVEIDLDKLSDLKTKEKTTGRSQQNNYDNKAFELEDVSVGVESNSNPFNRMDRPGSMMSIRSTTSRTSKTSVNCTSGRVRCPNMRLQKFFSYQEGNGFSAASEDIKKLLLPQKDGNLIGVWLLVEISYWDLHREKVVVLTDNSVINVTYDFISKKITDYNRIMLADLKKVRFGSLTYPKGSMMGEYAYGAVKLIWGDENLSFTQRWNPFNYTTVPFIVFTSHHILYNEKEKESSIYNCDEFIASLEYAINKMIPADPTRPIEFIEQPIEIPSYASLVSVMYNQNWLGFQLDRNGINF